MSFFSIILIGYILPVILCFVSFYFASILLGCPRTVFDALFCIVPIFNIVVFIALFSLFCTEYHADRVVPKGSFLKIFIDRY